MDNNRKIRLVSTLMELACNAYLLLAPLLLVGFWLNFERFGPSVARLQNLPIQMQNVGVINLSLGFLVSTIPVALLMYGVWRLRLLFRLYKSGALFTEANAGHIHAFAAMLLASVLASPIVSALLSVVLTMDNPPGQRAISLTFSSNDLGILFIAGILLAIAWIMREGHRLATENAEFI